MRGKVLGLAGLGRIGQEVARRAQGVRDDGDCSRSVHLSPGRRRHWRGAGQRSTTFARAPTFCRCTCRRRRKRSHIFNAARFAACKKGLKIINTARGELIDEPALVEAITSGQIGGAALDVFTAEPTTDHALQQLPQVVASPHIAASTREGQELVGVETASALRDFLKTGVIRNAVNFPSVAPEEFQRLQPFIKLGRQLGCLVGQMGEARIESLGVRYYGDLASGQHPLIVNAVLVGLFQAILSDTVTEVNARAVATARGIDLIESSSTRSREYRSLLSVKLMTSDGERWVEGTVAANNSRLILLNGVPIEAPLDGHAAADCQSRPARRHRRSRHHSRQARHQHRQLRPRPQRHRRGRRGERRRTRRTDWRRRAEGDSRGEAREGRLVGEGLEEARAGYSPPLLRRYSVLRKPDGLGDAGGVDDDDAGFIDAHHAVPVRAAARRSSRTPASRCR